VIKQSLALYNNNFYLFSGPHVVITKNGNTVPRETQVNLWI